MQRREALVAKIGHIRPQLAQAVDQIADRPFVHAGHTLQHIVTAGQRQRRGQRTKCYAGIAEEKLGLAHRKAPSVPRDSPALAA